METLPSQTPQQDADDESAGSTDCAKINQSTRDVKLRKPPIAPKPSRVSTESAARNSSFEAGAEESSFDAARKSAGVEESSSEATRKSAGVEESSFDAARKSAGAEESSSDAASTSAGAEESSSDSISKSAGAEESSSEAALKSGGGGESSSQAARSTIEAVTGSLSPSNICDKNGDDDEFENDETVESYIDIQLMQTCVAELSEQIARITQNLHPTRRANNGSNFVRTNSIFSSSKQDLKLVGQTSGTQPTPVFETLQMVEQQNPDAACAASSGKNVPDESSGHEYIAEETEKPAQSNKDVEKCETDISSLQDTKHINSPISDEDDDWNITIDESSSDSDDEVVDFKEEPIYGNAAAIAHHSQCLTDASAGCTCEDKDNDLVTHTQSSEVDLLEKLKKMNQSEICAANVLHQCLKGQSCPSLHFQLPYFWLRSSEVKVIQFSLQWSPVSGDDHETLEKLYCDPAIDVDTVTLGEVHGTVDFVKMTWKNNDGCVHRLQRLCTPPATAHNYRGAYTKWLWYYQHSEDRWKVMRKDQDLVSASLELEAAYQSKESTFTLESEEKKYIIDLKSMTRTNAKTGYMSAVKRRPYSSRFRKRPSKSKETKEKHKDTSESRHVVAKKKPEVEPSRQKLSGLSTYQSKHSEDQIHAKLSTICTRFLQGACIQGDQCDSLHCTTPYLWIWISEDGGVHWLVKDKNMELEKQYCDPAVVVAAVATDNYDEYLTVDFDTMKMITAPEGDFVRASTPSYESAQCDLSEHNTTWIWYWRDDNEKWIPYPEWSPHRKGISYIRLESCFQKGETVLEFSIDNQHYKIDLEKFTQTNILTNKVRYVRRRPKISQPERRSYPSHWHRPHDLNTYHRLTITEQTIAQMDDFHRAEYETVVTKFKSTCVNRIVICVECIQNYWLFDDYERKKEKLKQKWESDIVTELLLFHGTDYKHLEAICQQGFDFRLAGQATGTRLGKGSYFARDAAYSLGYTKGGPMFVAKVLVGRSTLGRKDLTRPPEHSQRKLYDSCVDSVTNPSMYVIYDLDQAYPAYLIHYT